MARRSKHDVLPGVNDMRGANRPGVKDESHMKEADGREGLAMRSLNYMLRTDNHT